MKGEIPILIVVFFGEWGFCLRPGFAGSGTGRSSYRLRCRFCHPFGAGLSFGSLCRCCDCAVIVFVLLSCVLGSVAGTVIVQGGVSPRADQCKQVHGRLCVVRDMNVLFFVYIATSWWLVFVWVVLWRCSWPAAYLLGQVLNRNREHKCAPLVHILCLLHRWQLCCSTAGTHSRTRNKNTGLWTKWFSYFVESFSVCMMYFRPCVDYVFLLLHLSRRGQAWHKDEHNSTTHN